MNWSEIGTRFNELRGEIRTRYNALERDKDTI